MKSNFAFWIQNLIILIVVLLARAFGIIGEGDGPAMSVVVGQALYFGVQNDHDSLVSQRISVAKKVDKKMARDKGGKVVSVAYYNETADISVEGLGKNEHALGTALTLTNPPVTPTGQVFVEEVTVDEGNEEFTKSSIKATAYSGIT